MRRVSGFLGAVLGVMFFACGFDRVHDSSAGPFDGMTTPDAAARDGDFKDAASETAVDGGARCPPGSKLEAELSSCPGAPLPVPAVLRNAAGTATRGEVIPLGGLDPSTAPCLPVLVCMPADAPTMIFSDEPESPGASGVLYADVVGPGRYRVYIYHVNGGAAARKFSAVLLNQGAVAAHGTIGPRGIARPSTNYVSVGKAAAAAWLSSTTTSPFTVPAGMRVLLDPPLDGLAAQTGELIHAILDFNVDAPVKLSIVTVLSTEDTVATTAGLPLLANTGRHVRGTFPFADRVVVSSLPFDGAGVRILQLGGNVTDRDLKGTDAVDGNTGVTLLGNYGMVYRIVLDVGARTAFAIAPRGGAWGGAANLSSGDDADGGVRSLPSIGASLGTTTDAIDTGTYPASSVVSARLLSAGGSSLPLDLLSIPLP